MTSAEPSVPLAVRVQLGHAAVQSLADTVGARVLHVKGFALDDELRWPGRQGTDVDVLVHPDGLHVLLGALRAAGWRNYTGFEAGSAFGHAATLRHEHFGYVDVHRFFPGLGSDPATAFDILWRDRHECSLGGARCAVPSVAGQTLILLLHAGRSVNDGRSNRDVQHAWGRASAERRASVESLVREVGAEVGFAAAVGDLERYRDRAEYDLWRVSSRGGTRLEEWVARFQAAPSARAKVLIALRAPLVNVEHMTAQLGRRPTTTEVVREFFARPARGVVEQWQRRGRS